MPAGAVGLAAKSAGLRGKPGFRQKIAKSPKIVPAAKRRLGQKKSRAVQSFITADEACIRLWFL